MNHLGGHSSRKSVNFEYNYSSLLFVRAFAASPKVLMSLSRTMIGPIMVFGFFINAFSCCSLFDFFLFV